MIVSNYDILFQTNQHMAEWLQHQLLPTQRVLKVGTHNITFLQCLMAFEGSLDVIFDDPVLLDQFNPNDATTVLFSPLESFSTDKQYDAIIFDFFEEDNDTLLRLLRYYSKFLASSGQVIFLAKNSSSFSQQIQHKIDKNFNSSVGFQTVSSIDTLFANLAFDIEKKQGFSFQCLPNEAMAVLPKNVVDGFQKIEDYFPLELLDVIAIIARRASSLSRTSY